MIHFPKGEGIKIISQESDASVSDSIYILPISGTHADLIIVDRHGRKRRVGVASSVNLNTLAKVDASNLTVENIDDWQEILEVGEFKKLGIADSANLDNGVLLLTNVALLDSDWVTTTVTQDDTTYEVLTIKDKTIAIESVSRPSATLFNAGAMIFDTTLGKPLWSDGTDWRDATGTIV